MMSDLIANDDLGKFVSRLESLAQVAETAGYLLKRDPTEIKEGQFNKNVPFRQVWFYKSNLTLAFTQYDASDPNWYDNEKTIARLLELEADSRLGLPSGAQMLEIDAAPESIKSGWKFVCSAAGPVNPVLLAVFGFKIYSLIFTDDDKRLFKLYFTFPIDQDVNEFLVKLTDSIKSHSQN